VSIFRDFVFRAFVIRILEFARLAQILRDSNTDEHGKMQTKSAFLFSNPC